MTEELPRNLSSFDATCEQAGNLLNVSKRKIAQLIREAIGEAVNANPNNIFYEVIPQTEGQVVLEAQEKKKAGAKVIRLCLKIILPRGGASGTLADERILKITRESDTGPETLVQEIV
ncbi:hypothetical protein KKA33_02550 [Patescibacteria group bacterium]|nr:hypothetical protein [Patescibacteria group bacterium]